MDMISVETDPIHRKKGSRAKNSLSAYVRCFEDGLEDSEIAILLGVSETTVWRKRREWIARISDSEPSLELVVESPNYNPNDFNADNLALVSFEGKVDYMLAQHSYYEAIANHNNIIAENIRMQYLAAIQEVGLQKFIKNKEPSEINFIYRMLYGRV